MTELKPCPFCGGEAEFVNYGENEEEDRFEDWSVECLKCGTLVICRGEEEGAVTTKEEAAENWNRRASE